MAARDRVAFAALIELGPRIGTRHPEQLKASLRSKLKARGALNHYASVQLLPQCEGGHEQRGKSDRPAAVEISASVQVLGSAQLPLRTASSDRQDDQKTACVPYAEEILA